MEVRSRWRAAVLALIGVILPAAVLDAQWVERERLVPSDLVDEDQFGVSLALAGDTAIIGNIGDDDGAPQAGSATILRFDGTSWIEEQLLTASDFAENDFFGLDVAIDGDLAVVSATGADGAASNTGALYVFRWIAGVWVEEQKLTASDGAPGDLFGISVGIDGDWIIVGAAGDDDLAFSSGSVYAFRRNGSTWVETQKLLPSVSGQNLEFGWDVDIDGDVALIGTRGERAYEFQWNGTAWLDTQTIEVSTILPCQFGLQVGLSGDVAIFGCRLDVISGLEVAGSAFVFRHDGVAWVEEQKLTANVPEGYNYYGESVSISGDHALVGAVQNDVAGTVAGAGYLYRFTGTEWALVQEIRPSDLSPLDRLGRAVAIADEQLLITAQNGTFDGLEVGAVYHYTSPIDPFIRGRCNPDSLFNVADPVFLIQYLFLAGVPPTCEDACDTNDDGVLDIADVVASLARLFLGSPIPAPVAECGEDVSPDGLECLVTASCL